MGELLRTWMPAAVGSRVDYRWNRTSHVGLLMIREANIIIIYGRRSSLYMVLLNSFGGLIYD